MDLEGVYCFGIDLMSDPCVFIEETHDILLFFAFESLLSGVQPPGPQPRFWTRTLSKHATLSLAKGNLWAPGLCAGPHHPPYGAASSGSTSNRSQFTTLWPKIQGVSFGVYLLCFACLMVFWWHGVGFCWMFSLGFQTSCFAPSTWLQWLAVRSKQP